MDSETCGVNLKCVGHDGAVKRSRPPKAGLVGPKGHLHGDVATRVNVGDILPHPWAHDIFSPAF